MRYYLETYGCQMNVADSELLVSLLNDAGHSRTDSLDDAKIILVNTCAIREKAEETVHARLGQLAAVKRKDPSVMIGLLGCMAKNLADSLLDTKPYVDMILGPDSYRKLPEIINQRSAGMDHIVDTQLSKFEVYEELFPSRGDGVNAWISIMRGCDKFCTFCIVPFTRGRERSRSVESIVTEAERAVQDGFREVTLLGQNVNSFRHEGDGFPELLEAVSKVKGVERIRFTSPHPSDINDEMLEVMAAHPNICNSIHLPLQAGNNFVLERMNRTYTREEFLTLVEKIRRYLPHVTLTTDVIVGFPGETEEAFQDTLDMMELVKFDSAFMFKYSSRPGTKASEYFDQVPEAEKQNRLERLIEAQKAIGLELNQRMVGKVVTVLIEKESKKSPDQWAGRNEGNKWVIFDKGDSHIGGFVLVQIDSSFGISLKGHLVKTPEAYHAFA